MFNNDRLLVQILLLALLGACFWVLMPFFSALFWAAVLAFASWPLMRLLTQWLNGRESLAAALLTAVWMGAVAVPLVWLGFNLADHLRDVTILFKDMQAGGLPHPPAWLSGLPFLGPRLVDIWEQINREGSELFASMSP